MTPREAYQRIRAAWHRTCHGEPLRHAGHRYGIVWCCPCGRQVGESIYPPSEALLRAQRQHQQRLRLVPQQKSSKI